MKALQFTSSVQYQRMPQSPTPAASLGGTSSGSPSPVRGELDIDPALEKALQCMELPQSSAKRQLLGEEEEAEEEEKKQQQEEAPAPPLKRRRSSLEPRLVGIEERLRMLGEAQESRLGGVEEQLRRLADQDGRARQQELEEVRSQLECKERELEALKRAFARIKTEHATAAARVEHFTAMLQRHLDTLLVHPQVLRDLKGAVSHASQAPAPPAVDDLELLQSLNEI